MAGWCRRTSHPMLYSRRHVLEGATLPFLFSSTIKAILEMLFGLPKGGDGIAPEADELAGLPLDYLIGQGTMPATRRGRIVEVAYNVDAVPPGENPAIAYGNLFDEENTGDFGPYEKPGDTASQYGEGQIDPSGPGWVKNLKSQYERRRKAGFKYIELDNPDAYQTKDVIGAINLAEKYGLRVIAKNAAICSDPVDYLRHKNVYGLIVEKGAGGPTDCDRLRKAAGKPRLPVWFVFFGNTRLVAEEAARIIQRNHYFNMGVTYSSRGEYGSSEDVMLPIRG